MESDSILNQEYNKKKKILTNIDKNNYNYYSELNSRDPRTYNQPIDYYDLLKQQIKYYKELNASLKEEIETVKKCKKIKQLEELNDINKLALINKDKDEINNFLTSNNNTEEHERMRQEISQNELKITDLQTKNKKLEESVIQLKNTLDRANDIFPNLMERLETYEGNFKGTLDFHGSSNFGDSKNSPTKQTNIIYGNSGTDEHCILLKKELKRLEEENIYLKNNINKLNQTIKYLKTGKIDKKDININYDINNKINERQNGEIIGENNIINDNININYSSKIVNGKYNGDSGGYLSRGT